MGERSHIFKFLKIKRMFVEIEEYKYSNVGYVFKIPIFIGTDKKQIQED